MRFTIPITTVILAAAAPFALSQSLEQKISSPYFLGSSGGSVARIGDINNDGYVDFAVGTPHAGTYFSGVVDVYSGKDYSTLFHFAGDERDLFGTSIVGPGDVTGDGVPDIVIGAVEYYADVNILAKGYVRLYSGKTGNIRWQANGAGSKEYLGSSLAAIGDINNDGKTDFVAGTAAGAVRVLSGSNGVILQTIAVPGSVPKWALKVAGVGDVNLDGTPDFLVGVPLYGSAVLYSGKTFTILAIWYATQSQEYYGNSVASVGDLNVDGIPDFAVGAPQYDSTGVNDGKVDILAGGSGVVLRQYFGMSGGALFGTAIAPAGDRDMDGFADLLVSAPAQLTSTGMGEVSIFSGLNGVEIVEFDSTSGIFTNTNFGYAVADGGDTNADGSEEILIGAPGETYMGMAYVFGSTPAGTLHYGSGSPGCLGSERIATNSVPFIGNANFEFRGDLAPSSAIGLCLVTNVQDLNGSDPFGFGILLYVNLTSATEVYALDAYSDSAGFGRAAIAIPNDPLLAGLQYYGQFVWVWPSTTCVPSILGLSSSNGVEVTIQM